MINCELYIGDVVLALYEGGFYKGVICGVTDEKEQFISRSSQESTSIKRLRQEQKKRDEDVKYIVEIDKIGYIEINRAAIDRSDIFISKEEFLTRVNDSNIILNF